MVRLTKAVAVLGLAMFLGCDGGEAEAPLHPVKGKVTLDGKPLKEGNVFFEADPPDGKAPVAAPIKDGQYEAKVSAGPKVVRISQEKVVKTPMGDATMEMKTETIPARYNAQSTLKEEVKDGDNSFDFDVKSK